MWPVVAMAAGSMLMNEMQRREANKQNAAQAAAQAAQTQFSPWTKMGAGQTPNYQRSQSNVAAGLQGGMAGASMAQAYDQAQSQKALAQSQHDLNAAQTQYYTNQNGGVQGTPGAGTFNPYAVNRIRNGNNGMA